MSTRKETIASLLDLIPLPVTAKAMFGEYALYLDGKVVALICDDTLFVQDLPASRAHLGEAPTGAPYPGAKPHIDASAALDDPETLARALRALAEVLPAPKPRKAK